MFDGLKKQKDETMDSIRKKNERIRHIQNELNLLGQLDGLHDIHDDDMIVDPQYSADERINAVIEVRF